nr:uncharacterized protein LOC113809928 [Penaeus vannamei]
MKNRWEEYFNTRLNVSNGKGCKDHRGIKRTEPLVKVVERVLDTRLRDEVKISNTQFGFMKGKNTIDAYYITWRKKFIESVWREGVPCMEKRRNLEIEVRLHKESALSPPLFVIEIDALTQHIATEGIWELSYADGLVVMAEQEEKNEDPIQVATPGRRKISGRQRRWKENAQEDPRMPRLNEGIHKADQGRWFSIYVACDCFSRSKKYFACVAVDASASSTFGGNGSHSSCKA